MSSPQYMTHDLMVRH